MSTTPVPRSSRRSLLFVLLALGAAFAVGRLSAPSPPPAPPIDLTQPITVGRIEPVNEESMLFAAYSFAYSDGRSAVFRGAPAPARRWSVTFTLEDGRHVNLACDLTSRLP